MESRENIAYTHARTFVSREYSYIRNCSAFAALTPLEAENYIYKQEIASYFIDYTVILLCNGKRRVPKAATRSCTYAQKSDTFYIVDPVRVANTDA